MSWEDEESHHTETLLQLPLGNANFLELQKSLEQANKYRITAGNLFGSQSAWFNGLEAAVRAAERTREHGRDNRGPVSLKKIPGFIRLEKRPKQEAEKEMSCG